MKGTLAGIVVVVLSVAAFLVLHQGDKSKAPDNGAVLPKGSITEVKPTFVESSTVPEKKVEEAVAPVKDEGKRYEDGVEVVSSTITTNTNGITTERLVLANGKKKKKVRHPKPIFKYSSDDLIATAISARPGESMPPLPIDSSIDKEFAESLLSPIRINDDDSDEVKDIKAKVIETRAYLVNEIKQGGSVYQALMDHQAELARISDSRLMAIQEMQRVRDEMGEDAAINFRDKINESFRIRGIPEIGITHTDLRNQTWTVQQ